MANQKHLYILKQGVDVWNEWRKEYPETKPDLSGLNLSGAKLRYAKFDNTDFTRANLSETDLSGSNLSNCSLIGVTLTGANISRVSIVDSDLSYSILSYAILDRSRLNRSNFSETDFEHANLNQTCLINANLYRAHLVGAYLGHAELTDADLSYAVLGRTHFDDLDMRRVKGLETVRHISPSTIGIDTIYRSEGNIPEEFLRKAGVPDHFITYMHSLIVRPIEYYSCFISYSAKDEAFAKRLHADLQDHNVRCWFAPEDLKIGDKFRLRIDESVRMYDKLLLVLSEASLASTWVSYEVERALDKEPEGVPNVLFPINVDKAILTCETDWAKDIRKSRHIGDFERWKDHDAYQVAFKRLLRDLKAQS